MTELVAEILENLQTEDESLQGFIQSFVACNDKFSIEKLQGQIRCKQEEYQADVRSLENRSFCSLFYASVYYLQRNYTEAGNCLEDAERGFNGNGQDWNLAIARWMHAVLYFKNEQIDLARREIEKAIGLLSRLALIYQRRGQYEQYSRCQSVIQKMKVFQPKTQPMVVSSPSGASNKSPRPAATPVRSDPLVFPIYDPVSAGKGADFIFDSEPAGEAVITELLIDERPFRVFSLHAGEPVVLHPRVYRWMYVVGNSMNEAKPYPLLEGDCLLVAETDPSGLKPRANDIVVAALVEPNGAAERAGVVKRYANYGLYSQSTESYPRIPLKKVRIKGIVVAVAKPVLN